MDFKLRMDDAARANLADLKLDQSTLQLTDSDLLFKFGTDFEVSVPLTSVAGAEVIPNPEPEVFLPHGVSEAVDKLGRETIAAIGAQDGLVAIDFKEPVEARTRPPDTHADEGSAESGSQSVTLRRLIVSPADPEAFAQAVWDRAGGTATQ